MMKRVISLLLCVLMLVPVMASCAKKNEDDMGAYINMYLTDQVYDLDPAMAYNNESALRLVSLVFDNLFVLDEKGNVKKSLADSYEINEDENAGEYEMIITLKETCWTDGTQITANDVYYAWTRVLQSDNNFDAASLLFDIKNARAAKEGDVSIDDVGISAINEKQIQIFFEGKVDYDHFLLNLTSYALVPLREDIVSKTSDWAKKPATICSSGPFRLREVAYEEKEIENEDGTTETAPKQMVLERNPYYYRDIQKDDIDESVTPYRIIVNYSMTDEEIMKAYDEGKIFFVGDIPLSVRTNYKDKAEVKDALSTHTYFLNQNAVIRKYNASEFDKLASSDDLVAWKNGEAVTENTEGDKIFAIPEVRRALSLAIDRDAIAEAVVFAKAATALVPYGVFDADSDKDLFREIGSGILTTSANIDEAKTLISQSGINAGDYMFAISVAAYDDVHMRIAEMVKLAWEELGFHVQIKAIDVIQNTDYMKSIDDTPKDIMDDIFAESFRAGKYEVAAIDYTALSADAFSMLSRFAKSFTGGAASSLGSTEFKIPAHSTGYDSEAYNALIEKAHAEKNIAARSATLHEAEKLLLDDTAVIPIIFNQTATLKSDELSNIKFTYYGTMIFTKTKLKDYELYVPKEEE